MSSSNTCGNLSNSLDCNNHSPVDKQIYHIHEDIFLHHKIWIFKTRIFKIWKFKIRKFKYGNLKYGNLEHGNLKYGKKTEI